MADGRPESLAAIKAEIEDFNRTIATLEEVLERQPPGCEAELRLKMALEKGAARKRGKFPGKRQACSFLDRYKLLKSLRRLFTLSMHTAKLPGNLPRLRAALLKHLERMSQEDLDEEV